jgi:hypothetical protein
MKRLIGIMVIGCLASFGAIAAPQRPLVQVCQWGGSFGSETGVTSFEPGLTLSPAPADIPFKATGDLTGGGRCRGTLTFEGVIRAGSTCVQQWFDGSVKGLPGVARFSGPGLLGVVHEFLYDHQGGIVGADQPLLKFPQPDGYSHAQDCATPEGFTRALFSSTIELVG